MRKILILLGLALSLLFSCDKETNDFSCDEEASDFGNKLCKKGHFYYTDKKYYIDSILQQDYLLIGFKKVYITEEINGFLNSTGIFNDKNVVEASETNYKLIIREFKSPKSCVEIQGIIDDLHDSEIVSFAAHTYTGEVCIGFSCTELMSYSNEFLVSLNDTNDVAKSYALVNKTNTRVSEKKRSYFVIETDKNAQGSALQMANLFYESGIFHFSHPNFHYFGIN